MQNNNKLLNLLNKYSWDMIQNYNNLDIFGTKVTTPYHSNIVEEHFINLMRKATVDEEMIDIVHELYVKRKVEYGWYRGKGLPEQIKKIIN